MSHQNLSANLNDGYSPPSYLITKKQVIQEISVRDANFLGLSGWKLTNVEYVKGKACYTFEWLR